MRRSWLAPGAVIVLAGILIAFVLFNKDDGVTDTRAGAERTAAAAQTPGPGTVTERRDADDILATGPVDAPVALVVFSDYQCKFCAKWSNETLPFMREKAETGNLRIEWRDVNIFGAPSERAARAAYAAAAQGKFWDFHGALFAGGVTRPESELTRQALVELAGSLGLDRARFERDFDAKKTRSEVARNQELGRQIQVRSTPSFVLNGNAIVGAQPKEVFVRAYDAALAGAKS